MHSVPNQKKSFQTLVSEAYSPSVSLAGRNLQPIGIAVLWTDDDVSIPLPLASASLDLVLNRHAGYNPAEIFRVLQPGGRFLTQQVGGKNHFHLNELFQDEPALIYGYWMLDYARAELEKAGFTILEQGEAFPEMRFLDIGALVYFLKIISWQVPDFSPHKDNALLRQIHALIEREGKLTTWQHRFFIHALKPF
jgi:SAM-dependent methyltransferase